MSFAALYFAMDRCNCATNRCCSQFGRYSLCSSSSVESSLCSSLSFSERANLYSMAQS